MRLICEEFVFLQTQFFIISMKVKSILISQPKPEIKNSPYVELIKKFKLKVDFRPFIHIEGKTSREVRQQKIDLSKFSAIILTSRNSVDHFFRIAEEMRYPIPNALKYFCLSEAVAFYLQKYVVYRKRKIYVGGRTFDELTEVIKKYPDESNVPRPPHWSGWRVLPDEIEFWVDGEGRIHERLNYKNKNGKWEKELLYP